MPLFSNLFLILSTIFLKLVECSPVSFKASLIEENTIRSYLNINSVEQLNKSLERAVTTAFHPHIIISIVIETIFVFGLWNLKQWSRIGTILYSLYSIIFRILTFKNVAKVHLSQYSAYVVGLILPLAVIYYLSRTKVKALFKPESFDCAQDKRGEVESKE